VEKESRRSPRWSAAALLAALMLTVAACGGNQGGGGTSPSTGGGGTSPSTGASPSEGEASPSEGEASPSEGEASPSGDGQGTTIQPPTNNVQLDYWNPFTGADGDTMSALVEQFNSETPSVQITEQRTPEYYTQINNAIQAGALPDVMIMHADQLALYAANQNLQPVTDLASQLGVSAEDFTEAVWAGSQWQGTQYSIPLDIHPATLYMNMALLEEAGVTEPPTDGESFEQALQACKDAGITGPVWSNHFFSASLFWASLFYQGGGEWTNEDYTQATFNSDAGVQATSYMRGLIEQGLHPQDVEADAEVSSFESGDSCMAITGIWQTTRFQEALGDDFAAGPIPQIFDNPGVWAGSHTLAIREGLEGDELQGAYYFIDWLTSHSLEWAAGGQIPARTSVREDPGFEELEHIPDIAEQVDAARFPPPIPGSADLLGAPDASVTVCLLENLTQGGDPKPCLDQTAETFNQILAENKERYGF